MVSPIFLAHAINKFTHARKDSVDDHLLTASQRNLMMVVGFNEGSTQLELARLSHLKPPTVCIAMQKMEVRKITPPISRALITSFTVPYRRVLSS